MFFGSISVGIKAKSKAQVQFFINKSYRIKESNRKH